MQVSKSLTVTCNLHHPANKCKTILNNNIIYLYYLCTLLRNGISRQVNGKQEGIIHFTGDHTISGGNQVIKDRQVSAPGYSGKGQGDTHFHAKIWLHQ